MTSFCFDQIPLCIRLTHACHSSPYFSLPSTKLGNALLPLLSNDSGVNCYMADRQLICWFIIAGTSIFISCTYKNQRSHVASQSGLPPLCVPLRTMYWRPKVFLFFFFVKISEKKGGIPCGNIIHVFKLGKFPEITSQSRKHFVFDIVLSLFTTQLKRYTFLPRS